MGDNRISTKPPKSIAEKRPKLRYNCVCGAAESFDNVSAVEAGELLGRGGWAYAQVPDRRGTLSWRFVCGKCAKAAAESAAREVA